MTTNRTDEATLLADHLIAVCKGELTGADLADWFRAEFPDVTWSLGGTETDEAWLLAAQYADVETDDDDLHALLLAECARLVTA